MEELKCLIIADTLSDSTLVEDYINRTSDLCLIAQCNEVNCIQETLSNHHISVIFFDIDLLKNNRFDLIRELGKEYPIILISAFREYALEGFDLDVIDYLLKPVSYPRFLKAISKLNDRLTISEKNKDASNYLFVKSSTIIEKINFSEILYIEAFGNYVRIHLNKRVITTYTTLKNIEHSLPNNLFVKVHKSFIVALNKIEQIEGNKIMIDKICISISRLNKHTIISKLMNHRISYA